MAPLGSDFTTILPNWRGSERRPSVSMLSWNAPGTGTGGWLLAAPGTPLGLAGSVWVNSSLREARTVVTS